MKSFKNKLIAFSVIVLLLFSCAPTVDSASSYNIIYHSNGGTGDMANQSIVEGSSASLKANSFTRTDYRFLGWSTLPDGNVEYSDEASFTMGNSDVNLYAIWETNVTAGTISPYLSTAESMNTDTSAKDYIQATEIGWNLGNQLDANNGTISSETAWSNPTIKQDLLDEVAAQGFGIVRIPVTWLGHIGDASSGYKVDEAWLQRVAEVAGYVNNAGMKAIINIHHDGADSAHWLNIVEAAADEADRARIDNMLECVWTQIANYFINHGDWLIFEGMNEIHDGQWGWGDNRTDGGLQYSIVNQWNQTFVNAVRATGGNNAYRYLTVCGYVTNPELTMNYMVIPSDSASNRLIVSVHYYDPNVFAISAETHEWGEIGTAVDDWGQESDMTNTFNALKTKYLDAGYALYLGECGATYQSGYTKFRNYYMEYMVKAAYDRGIVPIYWDNNSSGSGGESFGLINRSNFTVYSHAQETLDAMMNPIGNSYSLSDVVSNYQP